MKKTLFESTKAANETVHSFSLIAEINKFVFRCASWTYRLIDNRVHEISLALNGDLSGQRRFTQHVSDHNTQEVR